MPFNKLLFYFRKPRVVFVMGSGQKTAKEAILKVVGSRFKFDREIIVCDDSEKDADFLLKKSRMPILVLTHLGEYHPEKEFFDGELKDAKEMIKSASLLPGHAFLVLNFDDETVRDIKNQSRAHSVTFGFGLRSDVRVTDIVLTQFPGLGANFKINHEGNIIPVWMESLFGKENIYAALAAAAVGEVLGLNMVEISEALKEYKGISGRMKLIKGIKNSLILDDSENASSLSMLESLSILKKIEGVGRKIAVLGDILGIGKYSIEAHEELGGEAKNAADLLVTVGDKAKFFAQGARIKGMPDQNIREFSDAVSAGAFLQNEIKEGDLILIDGSKEMSMIEIVNEVKA